MVSTRALKQIELKTIRDNIDWETLAELVKKKKKTKAGRPFEYTDEQMLKVVILQDKEGILYDTDMERKLKSIKDYRNFCEFGKDVPSHDTITRFKKRLNPNEWKKLFDRLDEELDEQGYFKEDDLCGDGTDIPLPENVGIATYGAKSDKNFFLGLWLTTLNSTRREIVRDFNIGTGEIGQYELMLGLLYDTEVPSRAKDARFVSLDGIFDSHEIRQRIFRVFNKIPVIPYNPRNSKIKNVEDLPNDDWRLVFTPFLKNRERFKQESKKRTSSERENSRLKELTLIGRLKEKARRAYWISGKYIVNQTIISLIATQISALAEWVGQKGQTVIRQLTLPVFTM